MSARDAVRFHTWVARQDGGLKQHYLPVPPEVSDPLDAAGIRRVIVTIGPHTWRRALLGRKDGERQLMFSRAMMRETGLGLGDGVDVTLVPDPDPERVDIPEAFREVLAQDPEAARRFEAFTPGLQRSLVHYVASAKRVDTQIRRALELAGKIRTRTLHMDRD